MKIVENEISSDGMCNIKIEMTIEDIPTEVQHIDDVLTPLGKAVFASLGVIPVEWLED